MTATALLPPGAHGFIAAGNSAGNMPRCARGAAAGGSLHEAGTPQLAIVVPAREVEPLRRTLRGLAMETVWDGDCTVLVATGDEQAAALAREAGAQLLPVVQGDEAGMALDAVLRRAAQRLPASAGWVLVVQAGSDLAPGVLEALRLAIADDSAHAGAEADALQCRVGRRGAAAPPATARARLQGNGFALSRAALQRLVNLGPAACAGWRVRGVDGALLLDDGPCGQARAPWAARAPLALRALRALREAAGRAVRVQAWRGRGAGRAA